MEIKHWLDRQFDAFNNPSFIAEDPISVPHRFTKLQDREIAGFFAAIMAWGQRQTIINKCNELISLMDDDPHQFIIHHKEYDRKVFLNFRHRTLQPDDVICLVDCLQRYYADHASLENAFADSMSPAHVDTYAALSGFHDLLFDHPHIMQRTRKHIATPVRKSSCKRLSMFLRWMVRSDDRGVDFGVWKKISPAQLIIPLDLHVGNTARKLGLLKRHVNDWQAAVELTMKLRQFDADDPVKYDFALFNAGLYKLAD